MWATEEDIKANLEERECALKFIAMKEIEIAAEVFQRFERSKELEHCVIYVLLPTRHGAVALGTIIYQAVTSASQKGILCCTLLSFDLDLSCSSSWQSSSED
jgi:hypothetical protein